MHKPIKSNSKLVGPGRQSLRPEAKQVVQSNPAGKRRSRPRSARQDFDPGEHFREITAQLLHSLPLIVAGLTLKTRLG